MLLDTKEVMLRTGLKRSMVMKLVHAPDSPWFRISERAYVVEEKEFDEQIRRRKYGFIRNNNDGACEG